jgi:hypothetical protein
MKLQEIIERAQRDESFASRLKAQATRASQAGVGTDDWERLMWNFAESPDELAQLKVLRGQVDGVAFNTTTTTTTTTITTTAACTLTTFTTTTTVTTDFPWAKAPEPQ